MENIFFYGFTELKTYHTSYSIPYGILITFVLDLEWPILETYSSETFTKICRVQEP